MTPLRSAPSSSLRRNNWHGLDLCSFSVLLMDSERPVPAERIVAVALLTRPELLGLGAAFKRAWPVVETPGVNGLLDAVDAADRQFRQEKELPKRSSKEGL